MKKNYFHFVIIRALIGVLIGIIIFFSSVSYLKDVYYRSIELGLYQYEDTLKSYIREYSDSNKDLDQRLFMKQLAFDSAYDYLRIVRIKDDGSYDTLCETDYGEIPIFVVGMAKWIVVTKELPDISNRQIGTEYNLTSIDYRKCDEIWGLDLSPSVISDSGTLIWFSRVANVGNYAFNKLYRAVLDRDYKSATICCDSYYLDEEYLHLGKVFQCDEEYRKRPDGKTWDFTDSNNASLYSKSINDDSEFPEFSGYQKLHIYNLPVRPDKFFEQEGDLFLTSSSNDFYAYEKFDTRITDFLDFNRYSAEVKLENGRTTTGSMMLLNYGGERYLLEYVATYASFEEYFKPVLILYPVLLLLLCIGIPCLSAIAPYKRYKKENQRTASATSSDKIVIEDIVDSNVPDVKSPLRDIGKYVKELKDAVDDDTKSECYARILEKMTELDIGIDEITRKPNK